MENASKALVMAGGILIAILVIGALLLMFNQIGSYENAKTINVKNSQLAQFNLDFEKYTDDNGISGADIISVINKVVDYNKKSGVGNSVNYDIKMSVTVEGLKSFKNKYVSGNNSLFKNDGLVVNQNNNSFSSIIDNYSQYESKYTLLVMSNLASNYDKLEKCSTSSEYKQLVYEITGKNLNSPPTLEQIRQYREYSEFKNATFKSNKESVYQNGQIRDLYFKFVK